MFLVDTGVLEMNDGPVVTTAHEYFTYNEHLLMAHLLWKRLGKDFELAAAKWRKVLDNDCPVADFKALVSESIRLGIGMKGEIKAQ